MANALLVYTMKASSLTARTAGTLSTAKIRSAASIAATTASSGVATRLPASLTKNLAPAYSSRTGMTLRSIRTAKLLPGSKLSSSSLRSL
ncbi:hypothetical protein SGLAM104S_04858 [Streptomyces glaucescens]